MIKKEKIDGVLPGCADILVPSYVEVCERLGLYCYINRKVLKAFNNKKGLKEVLRKYDLDTIPEYGIEEVRNAKEKIFPLFIKPVDNNSSKGMFVIDNIDEFDDAYDKAMQYSRSKTLLFEKKMECDDFVLGCILQN